MNTPIISPWVVYLIGFLDASQTLAILMLSAAVVSAFVYILRISDAFSSMERNKKTERIILRVLILSLLMLTFLPTKQTATQMVIASQITPTNVERANQSGIEVVDYLTAKLKEVVEASNGDKD